MSVFADCSDHFCLDAVVATGQEAGSTSYFARLISFSSSALHPNAPYEFTTNLFFRQIRIENLTEGGLAYDAPEIDLIENQYSGSFGFPQSSLTPGRLVGATDYNPYCPIYGGCLGTSSDNGYALDAVGRFQVVVTPEPATLALLVPGMLALAVANRRRGHGRNSE